MNSVIIFCAKYLIFVVALAAFAYWVTLPKKLKIRAFVFGIITMAIAYILAKIGSSLFYNARPFVSDHVVPLFKYTADNGFPSDHTLLSASIAVTLFTISKKWGVSFAVLAIIIGSSRVLAHVHHPIDIVGSLVFALIGGAIAYLLSPRILVFLSKSHFFNHLLETHEQGEDKTQGVK